jgi:hypothetical protein
MDLSQRQRGYKAGGLRKDDLLQIISNTEPKEISQQRTLSKQIKYKLSQTQ